MSHRLKAHTVIIQKFKFCKKYILNSICQSNYLHCYETHLSSFFVEIVEMKTSKATLKGDLNFKSNILTYKSK